MQIDIAQHIEKLLFQHETVIVPTFGGFTATRSPASLDAVGGTIAPPSKTLAFNENLTVDDGILVHDLGYTYGLSEDESRRLVLDFVENTKAALDQREIVTLPGVGRLYKNYAQKVQFLPDTTNFNTESFGLPKINFATAPRSTELVGVEAEAENETVAVATSSNGKAKSNGNGSIGKNKAAVQELLDNNVVKNAPIATQSTVAEISREVKKQAFSSKNWALAGVLVAALAIATFFMLNKKVAPPADVIANTTNQAPTPVPGVGELVNPVPMEEANVEPMENDDAGGDISDEVDEYQSKKIEAEKALVASQEKVKAKKEANARKTDADEKLAPAGSRRCVLIIGTFQDRANVNNLLKKLEDNGFDTYHRRVKGHQVGIEFFYSDLVEVQNNIKSLQALTGEDNIWIKKK